MNMQSPLEDSTSLARHARGSLDDMKAILNQGQKEIGVPAMGFQLVPRRRLVEPRRSPKRNLGKAETTN